MLYGHIAKKLPKQDPAKVMKLVNRFERALPGHKEWALSAKKCVDYFEGRQWTAEEITKRAERGLESLSFNEIGPLVRLVIGYFQNNKTETVFLPGNDAKSTQDLAELLSKIVKHIGALNQQPFVETEAYLDGLLTGRGFLETKLNFEENLLGDIEISAFDPFNVYLCPDSTEYDLDKHPYIQKSKMVSLDEIKAKYGAEAKELLEGFVQGDTWNGFPTSSRDGEDISPVRGFGMQIDEDGQNDFGGFQSTFFDHLYDTARKSFRLIDTEYWVHEVRPCFIDLETGDKAAIPDTWNEYKINAALEWAERIGNPMRVKRLQTKRVRWTVTAGDIILHDDWSPYNGFTLDGYFPYFRRGFAKGIVEDLIDPQDEVNRKRNLAMEIVGRQAKGTVVYEEDTFDPVEEERFKRHGSMPGFRAKTKKGMKDSIKELGTGPTPQAVEKLEQKGYENLRRTAGINESALGHIDKVQSGKAIIARQQQAVVGLQMYQTNWKRTKQLQGKNELGLIQAHYDDERIFRITGEDGKMSETIINQRVQGDDGVMTKLNDVTVGKYLVKVDETPMSSTFESAQFDEFGHFLERFAPLLGKAAPLLADIWIDMSSMPNKEEVKQRIQKALGIQNNLETSTAMSSGTVQTPEAMPPQPTQEAIAPPQ